ncbi:MAG: hypothetical protein A2W93_14495 [Bacteroidetes bacterium GWF2_43_63]|nr:MAG: hypothetical protein A2W94_01065 [Bacteroidetes bacterium GWE2_42_42]OFY52550.1 MAG: hypothetical protein A2W93_14495 [Bacteroidetes bacterium GWF2_43_63]HBG71458.1 hypothetical protein [Bacteroidales bacterium]HCB60790.1 hypothetical protein [Bacteroidales bacterium]HCY23485.1 hypothetical protein [Bacteroidales bacterium]
MEVKFYLRDKGKKSSAIYALIHFGYSEIDADGIVTHRPLKYNIRQSVETKYWDSKNGKALRSMPGALEFNQWMDDFRSRVLVIYRELLLAGKITPELLREKISDQYAAGPTENTSITFIEKFIHDCETGMKTLPAGKYSTWTIKGYKTTLQYIREYIPRFSFESFGIQEYNKFVSDLYDTGKDVNTLGKHVKNIKVFFRTADLAGVKVNQDYRRPDFRTLTRETESVYLTISDLDLIRDAVVPENCEMARDVFLVACYTGFRYSDLRRIDRDAIRNNRIDVKTKKTGANVVIPINATVLEILERRKYKLKIYSNQVFNRLIKDICCAAGLKDSIIKTTFPGGIRKDKTFEKWQLVSTHTARRSFATNAYLSGIPAIYIMKMTGHRTEKSFLKYIRISADEAADITSKYPFFD